MNQKVKIGYFWLSMGTMGMEFNVKKCKIIHIGRSNPQHDYYMAGHLLEKSEEERDIGVVIHSSLRPKRMCQTSARKAEIVLNNILRTFKYRDSNTYKQLYIQYVRPLLEFSSPVWCPWTQTDIDCLEKVQIKAVKQIRGLKGRTYQERLRELDMMSLETRRLRNDLIQTFKIIRGIDNVDKSDWFELYGNTTNSHVTRLNKDPMNIRRRKIVKTDIRSNFYSQRVIEKWNNLNSDIKNSDTLNQFKTKLDTILKNE